MSFFGTQAVSGGAFGFRMIQEVIASHTQLPVASGHIGGFGEGVTNIVHVLFTGIVPFGHAVTQV